MHTYPRRTKQRGENTLIINYQVILQLFIRGQVPKTQSCTTLSNATSQVSPDILVGDGIALFGLGVSVIVSAFL